MAGSQIDILNSIPGTRLMIWLYDANSVLSSIQGIDQVSRPWGNALYFDNVYLSSGSLTAVPLPCSQAEFSFGEPGYTSAGDALPGMVRVKMKRTGAYSHNLSFPLLISGDTNPLSQAYPILEAFLKNSGSQPLTSSGVYSPDIGVNMICLQDSYQKYPLPYILDTFSISASGIGQAAPIQCSISAKGIGSIFGISSNDSLFQFPNRNPLSAETSYSRDKSAPSSVYSAEEGTARVANIKDCWISIDELDKKVQIINMELNIKQTIDTRATAGFAPNPIRDTGDPFVTDDHIYVSNRTVSGSFSFLASSAIDPATGLRNSRYSPFSTGKTNSLAQNQWSSPIKMGFGPLTFSMPAAYWNPTSHKLSSGSTVYTVNFIARTIDPYGNREII